jgi:polysaccharide biosynthesis/export protein
MPVQNWTVIFLSFTDPTICKLLRMSLNCPMNFFRKKSAVFSNRLSLIVVILCSLAGFLFVSNDAKSQALEYKLGGGDSVRVAVFLNPELATEARLSEQGEINFPLVGLVKIAGLSITEAERFISDQLKQGGYVQKAQVLISITAYRSQVVSILGNVVRPGRYPLELPGIKLSELIAIAGGVSIGGSDTVILTRQTSDAKRSKFEIDLPSIFLEDNSKFDFVLQAGDSIYVHKQPNFYISGSIGRPGIYIVDRGLSIGQAIAKGGSYSLRSREAGVRLLRRDATGKIVERIPAMDELIQPDDHIVVRESLF